MNLEKLLGLNDGYLKRLADFYDPLEVTDTATLIPNPSPASRRREFDASTREAQEFSFSRLREKVAAKRSRPKRPKPVRCIFRVKKVRLGNKKLTDEGGKGCPPTQKHLEVQP